MRITDYENNNDGNTEGFSDVFDVVGVAEMSWSRGGNFTRNLLSLQLQLQTLLEGVGGEGTSSLLDNIAQLSEAERKRIIPLLSRVISRVVQGEKRLISAEDRELKEFEDSLFDSIMTSLGQSANDDRIDPNSERKLEVLSGGRPNNNEATVTRKPVKVPSLIDLAKARESRRHRFDTPPNEVS
ncbi:MAG: hypothetical protein ACK5Y6_04080 [Pseudomonadota bacterium]